MSPYDQYKAGIQRLINQGCSTDEASHKFLNTPSGTEINQNIKSLLSQGRSPGETLQQLGYSPQEKEAAQLLKHIQKVERDLRRPGL